jgi:hypothetical protein
MNHYEGTPMRSIALLIALFLGVILVGPALRGAPIDGGIANGMKVPDEGWTAIKRFRGGERACVHTAPAQQTVGASITITIHDASGKKIAEDQTRPDAPSFAAVFWYPPRDGDYKITISPSRADILYVAIR